MTQDQPIPDALPGPSGAEQPIDAVHDAQDANGAPELDPQDLSGYMHVVDKVMHSEIGRTAWLTGFLMGSALADDETKLEGA
jgi:hypothetical protein